MQQVEVYHGTSFGRAGRILRDGLQPTKHGYPVAVTDNITLARRLADARTRDGEGELGVVFLTELPESSLTTPYRWQGFTRPSDGKSWRYKGGRIRPGKLEIADIIREHDDGMFYRSVGRDEMTELKEILRRMV